MGNYTSKFFSHCEEHEKVKIQTDLTMSTIGNNLMCTPLMSKKVSADPRSVTVGICRTPIQVAATPSPSARPVASAIPKHLQMKKYLETNLDLILPAVTPVKRVLDPRSPNISQQRTPILIKTTTEYLSPIVVINEAPDMPTPQDLDPRSPAANFDRTPILKSKSTEQEDSPSCNPRIENSGIDILYCETTGNDNIPEIQTLLKNPKNFTTVKSRNLEERMKSCEKEDSENSENNVDKEREENLCSEDSEESETEDQITVIHNPRVLIDPQEAQIDSKTDELLEAILESQLKLDDALNPAASLEAQNEENKGKIVIWRDSLSSLTNVNCQDNCDSLRAPKQSKEIRTVYDSDEIPKVSRNDSPKSHHVKNEYKSKLPLINKSIKNKQAMKKEVKGVFDDANAEAGRSRVPLATRYNKNGLDISSKSPQLMLRTKNLSTQPGQQENTPPNSKRYRSKIKANGTHWDADMSVII